jgi:hypothetical protein
MKEVNASEIFNTHIKKEDKNLEENIPWLFASLFVVYIHHFFWFI